MRAHAMPSNFSWLTGSANTCASASWSARRTWTPNSSLSIRALCQREAWPIDASTDGGVALNDDTDVASSPHGSPSSARAVTTATPEQRPAIASRKISGTLGMRP